MSKNNTVVPEIVNDDEPNAIAGPLTTQACVELRDQGFKLTEIAEMFGVTHQAISARLVRYNYDFVNFQRLKKFKKNQADVFASVQMDALQRITPEKLDDLSVPQLITTAAIAFDKEQLARGGKAAQTADVLAGCIRGAVGELYGTAQAATPSEDTDDSSPNDG